MKDDIVIDIDNMDVPFSWTSLKKLFRTLNPTEKKN